MAKKTLYKIPTEEDIKKMETETTPPVEEAVVENLPVQEPEPVAVVDTAKEKKKRELSSEEKKDILARKEAKAKADEKEYRIKAEAARLERQSRLDVSKIEGFSVGGRATVESKNVRRLTRDRRREKIEERKSMKLLVAGEEQELSEASKYMLDMLIKNNEK